MVDSIIRIFGSSLNTNTSFASNGLGVLSEAISCIVTEERNGRYELEVDYPVTGAHADAIQLRNIVVAKPNPYSNPQPFRIYAISKPINGILHINAQHISYDLNGYVAQVLNDPADGIQDYFSKLSALITPSGCPFIFETTGTSSDAFKVKDILPVRKILGNSGSYTPKVEDPSGRISSDDFTGYILDVFPGEYEWDGLTVKHYATRVVEDVEMGGRGTDRGVSIRYGKNLTSFKQDQNCSNVYTGVYPYWHYTGYRHELVELPEKIIALDGTFDFVNILPMDLTSNFARRPSEEDMRKFVNDYISKNKLNEPEVSFDVSFVALAQTEEYKDYEILETVKLCDTVHVVFPLMGVSASAKVVSTEYDVIKDKYNSITLGSYKNGVSDIVATQAVTISERMTASNLESAVLEATERLTGQTGGYVVMNTYSSQTSTGDSTSGAPNEILIMDKPDMTGPNAATKVWRWNVEGLGFSPNGIAGPYTIAITADGRINADFITAGYMSGERIVAGSINASQISVEYTNAITTAFQVADNEIKTLMSDMQAVLQGGIDSNFASISSIQQSVEALNLSFSKQAVGGINKIQNSSGLNGFTDWQASQYGCTVVDQESSDSGKAFRLNNGAISQVISVNPNDVYAISLRAKTAITGSYVRLKGVKNADDSTFYVLNTNETYEELTFIFKTFIPSGDTITVELGSTGDSLYVSDLMLTPGNTQINWTPAPNEIYTTNVKVDRSGIRISNSDSDTQTLIDNTQFAVLHQGSTVLTVNKDVTQLQKTEISDQLQVGNLIIVPVEGGADLNIL